MVPVCKAGTSFAVARKGWGALDRHAGDAVSRWQRCRAGGPPGYVYGDGTFWAA